MALGIYTERRTGLLLEFTVLRGNYRGEQFRCYGVFNNLTPNLPLAEVEFKDVRMARLIDNSWCNKFEPEGVDWYGNKYTEEDVLTDVLADLIAGCNENYSVKHMSGDVHNMVRSYQLKKVADDLNLYVWRKGNILELQMATNKYLYYAKDDSFVMLNAKTKDLISDNYFAENAVWESVEAINAGEEQLIYGEDTYNSINSNMEE